MIESYGVYADGSTRSDGQLVLSQRVRRTTTPNADGGRYTVEEVEGRSFVAPSDPMRVMSRTVTTVRPVGAGRWITERQVFERDVNGRMQLIFNDAEAQSGR